MESIKKVTISSDFNNSMEVTMVLEGSRQVTHIMIDGIFYHLERMKKEEFLENYVVDIDPGFNPKTDDEGMCYIIAPFSKD